MNEPMTFLDFFSGVGGFRKGFELCGMVCKGHCEIDKFADRSYRAIHDIQEDEWYGEDITKTEPADLPRVNLWAGGFPCQDISVSGWQRGLAGKRSSLFFEIVRLLNGTPAEDRPEWLVLENVKNLLSVNRGWDFATVLHKKEAEAFQKKVKKSGLSREAYLRHLVNGLEPQDAPPPDYYAMMRELHGIGNNLNQIAAKAHTLNALDVQRYDENCRKLDEAIKTITAAVILPRPMK